MSTDRGPGAQTGPRPRDRLDLPTAEEADVGHCPTVEAEELPEWDPYDVVPDGFPYPTLRAAQRSMDTDTLPGEYRRCPECDSPRVRSTTLQGRRMSHGPDADYLCLSKGCRFDEPDPSLFEVLAAPGELSIDEIREAREAVGLARRELADRADVDGRDLRRLEAGEEIGNPEALLEAVRPVLAELWR